LSILENSKKFILDTLFPIQCISCGHDDIWLCENCFQKIQLLSFQLCPRCEKLITQDGRLCSFCKIQKPPLDALIVAARYKEGNISKLVHLYKYSFIENLHAPLGKLLTKALSNSGLSVPDFIIPVPLHPRRKRWRGFNQAELLAGYVGQNLTPGYAIPVFEKYLRRIRYTPAQMKIKDYFQRRKNICDAFSAVAEPLLIKNKNILLIDDIATTGATLFECARALKQNGAKKVFAAVIARQEIK
jgi:competence protein ComFC